MTEMEVKLGQLTLKNPLLTASGTFGYGREFAQLYDLSLLGGVVVKGTTLEPRPGNPPPRIAETAAGMLNSVGLQNPGLGQVIDQELPWLAQFDTAIFVNIAGRKAAEYQEIAACLDKVESVRALEVNISCPNVEAGGLAFGTDPKAAAAITAAVRDATSKPVFVKLSPNVTDIVPIAQAVEAAGADGITLVNTFLGLAIDIKTRRPLMANIVAGLSGPAIKPLALRLVWQTARAVRIPVIGIGGIMSGQDALEFMLAGARAVQIGTANFYNPLAGPQIIREMAGWLENEGVRDINEIVGEAL
ncbi:MAG: dihydroorotate dehydrogenase [Clostridiales bacterium]|jgi:dihydroorotate dehydrogenase (NAD+) catalytic subunit|nr:dihydroorotate dehydrogenase [Clostridiales bacterium]MDR2711554.1 dihydroorotate dehydrogenase [Clostridiales bacterium]